MTIKITAPPSDETEAPDAGHEDATRATAAQSAEVDRLAAEADALAAKIEDLQRRSDAALPDALDGKTKEYDRAEVEKAEAEKRLGMVQRAREIAAAKLADLRAAQQMAASAGQLKAIRRLCNAREKALGEMVTAFESAVKLYRELIVKSDQIAASWPRGIAPEGALLREHDIGIALQEELFRISGLTHTLPGARTYDVHLAGQPEKIRPLAEKIAECDAYLVRVLSGGEPALPKPAAMRVTPSALPSEARAASQDVPAKPTGPTVRADAVRPPTVRLK
jgi:hypothetical protein